MCNNNRLSDNYNLRQFYLRNNKVPSTKILEQTVPAPLLSLIMKSVTPKQRQYLDPEPSKKPVGPAYAWFVPPKEVLCGRQVKKPIKQKHLQKLDHEGIYQLGAKMAVELRKARKEELVKVQKGEGDDWLIRFNEIQKQYWDIEVTKNKRQNTKHIKKIFNTFCELYANSLRKIENLLHQTLEKKVMILHKELVEHGQTKYKTLLKAQAIMISQSYDEKLAKEKEILKSEFIEKIEICRTEMANTIHDVKVEKHSAFAKLRKYYECQNLACQIYVALKEREQFKENNKNIDHYFQKEIKPLDEHIKKSDAKIQEVEEEIKNQEEIKLQWQKNLCVVFKNFQMFVSFCLRTFPEHVEFFINLEKLMLLQLSEAVEDPAAESIIETKTVPHYTGPEPKPRPFYIFLDKETKFYPNDQNLKHNTSSSHLPVIVINKRCMYAACYKSNDYKMLQYIYDKNDDDLNFEENIITDDCSPRAKETVSQHLLELNLESSLFQILEEEMYSLKDTPPYCNYCKLLNCFCTCEEDKVTKVLTKSVKQLNEAPFSLEPGTSTERKYMKLPSNDKPTQFNSYLEYLKAKRCSCAKKAKKYIEDHLPAYMKRMSKFEPFELPNYETCPVETLRKLVEDARGRVSLTIPTMQASQKVDASTQCEVELDDDKVCICDPYEGDRGPCRSPSLNVCSEVQDHELFSNSSVSTFIEKLTSSFAMDRAHSLRKLLAENDALEEIFKKTDC